jgi:hypothetical protein
VDTGWNGTKWKLALYHGGSIIPTMAQGLCPLYPHGFQKLPTGTVPMAWVPTRCLQVSSHRKGPRMEGSRGRPRINQRHQYRVRHRMREWDVGPGSYTRGYLEQVLGWSAERVWAGHKKENPIYDTVTESWTAISTESLESQNCPFVRNLLCITQNMIKHLQF